MSRVLVTPGSGKRVKMMSRRDVSVGPFCIRLPASAERRIVPRILYPAPTTPRIVPETLGRIVRELGFSVTVHLRSGSGATSWEGRFARISDTIDPDTRTIGVIAAVDEAYAKARPGERPPLTEGLFVEVEIRAKPLEGRLIVPRASLREDQLLVMNAEDRLEIRAVEPELFQGDIVAIGEGLAPGERVVVSDLVPTVEGMLLSAREDAVLAASLRAKAAATEQLK